MVDNFDADIASQNGKLSTHSTQPNANSQHEEYNITQLKNTEMSKEIISLTQWPPKTLKKHLPPLKVLVHMVLSQ